MEIIKQSYLQHNHKKVFAILCIHLDDQPFLEGELAPCLAVQCSNSIKIHVLLNSLLEESPVCHALSYKID